ncbi:response regulator transcription factor [Pilimelia columellifera]|uniref:Response regulator transcription factor n=1 Tax=Pilimelia columellifera subsp. columellifera TaxID=706583 RepID=A0ABN3N0S9_9ACTN
MRRSRVLIVDRRPAVRSALRTALAGADRLAVVGEAGGADDGQERVRELTPDVALVSVAGGPDGDGVSVVRRLLEVARPPRVLALTAYDDERAILRAVDAGAIGWLSRDAEPTELARAALAAANGESVSPAAPAGAGATGHVPAARWPVSAAPARRPGAATALTRRERQVLRLIGDGLPNAAVAAELFISQETARAHLASLFAKLGVDSRAAVAAEARRRGLIR